MLISNVHFGFNASVSYLHENDSTICSYYNIRFKDIYDFNQLVKHEINFVDTEFLYSLLQDVLLLINISEKIYLHVDNIEINKVGVTFIPVTFWEMYFSYTFFNNRCIFVNGITQEVLNNDEIESIMQYIIKHIKNITNEQFVNNILPVIVQKYIKYVNTAIENNKLTFIELFGEKVLKYGNN